MYIYIHIPFCSNICSYCDFPKILYDKKYINSYLNTLREEILSRYKNEEVLSIYIGGGTPTSLDLDELESLLQITNIFNKSTDIEFTIESNIDGLSIEKIKLLKKYQVNRISLGVQSFHENTLRELNRCHTKRDVFKVIRWLKENKFSNISIDYIYGIHPDIEEVKEDIELFLKLDIPHISCYSLIIEENTMFYIHNRDYIEEDIEEKMYHEIESILEDNGYIHYELSNYAKEGYFSKHNINYWNNLEYYGFGMGAVSYLNHYRIINTKNLTKYLEGNYINNKEYENKELEISNTFMLGFRKIKGINIREFKDRYGIDIFSIEVINRLLKEKKLVLEGEQLFIHPDYIYLSNEIIREFI